MTPKLFGAVHERFLVQGQTIVSAVICRTSIPGFHKAFEKRLRTPQQGVDTIVWLALEVTSLTHALPWQLSQSCRDTLLVA